MHQETDDSRLRLDTEIDAAKADLRTGDFPAARRRLSELAPLVRKVLPLDAADGRLQNWALWIAVAARDSELAADVYATMDPSNPYRRPLKVSPALTLREWCEKGQCRHSEVEAPHEVVLAASPYSAGSVYVTGPIDYLEIPGGQMLGGWDYVVTGDGTVLIDTCYLPVTNVMAPYPHLYVPMFKEMLHHVPPHKVRVREAVLRVGAPHALHFGHWLADFLPRLYALKILKDSSIRIAVPNDIPPKFHELLAHWNIGEDRLFYCRRDTAYTFDQLHVLHCGSQRPPNPTILKDIRDHLYVPGSTPGSPRTRIFASRAERFGRSIENWEELRVFLEEEGFIDVDFAEMSIAERKAAMADAEILLGVYGSNLFGLYFAPQTCTTITIMPQGLRDTSIRWLCGILGMRHQYLMTSASNAGERGQLKDTRLRVDIDELRARLRELHAGRNR